MNTIDKVKQWFIDRDLKYSGRLDKQSLKLIEEFGELCAGYLKRVDTNPSWGSSRRFSKYDCLLGRWKGTV